MRQSIRNLFYNIYVLIADYAIGGKKKREARMHFPYH
jgi:hypothetical protein